MHSPNDSTKTCSKCGETKPLDAYYLDKRRNAPRAACKMCYNADTQARYAAAPDKHYALTKRWREEHRSEVNEAAKRRHAENPEPRHRAVAKWQRKNPEKVRANSHKMYYKHREDRRRRSKEYYCANRDTALTKAAEWRRANPERLCDYSRARHARKVNAPEVENIRRADIWDRDGGICYLCETPCDPNNWHLEHLIPLSRGGPHTASNVAVSHPECNRAKGTRTPDELARMNCE